ncbi:MAG: TRAP transporter large permease [Syntrophales bacterium]
MTASAWLAIIFVILVVMGLPISISIGISAIVAASIVNPSLISMFPSMMYGSLDSFLLVAIPLFMLGGYIMEKGGTSQLIFDFAGSWMGWMRGGLGAVSVFASMIFGGISGSSVADAAGLGPIQISAMMRSGYPKDYSAAVAVAASSLAVVIPPSILMVIYAIIANQSVGACLLAGLLPGLFIGLTMIVFNYFICRRRGWGHSSRISWRNILYQGKRTFWAVLTPFVLLGGLMSGLFTPTEAAAISVLYVVIISLFVYKEMKPRQLFNMFLDVVRLGGPAVFIICTASIAGYILTVDKIPNVVAETIVHYLKHPWLVLLAINIFLLIVGCFMDAVCSLIILVPLLLPIIQSIGVSPVHFSVIMIANLAIGLITPPVGVCLYVICSVAKISLEDLVRAAAPLLCSLVISLLIITYWPPLSLFVPKLLGLIK